MTHECNKEAFLNQMMVKISDIHKIFYGPPGEPKKGLLIEIDRNTGHRLWMSKWGWMVLGICPMVIGGAVAWVLRGLL